MSKLILSLFLAQCPNGKCPQGFPSEPAFVPVTIPQPMPTQKCTPIPAREGWYLGKLVRERRGIFRK